MYRRFDRTGWTEIPELTFASVSDHPCRDKGGSRVSDFAGSLQFLFGHHGVQLVEISRAGAVAKSERGYDSDVTGGFDDRPSVPNGIDTSAGYR
jgi:hypothetical protein